MRNGVPAVTAASLIARPSCTKSPRALRTIASSTMRLRTMASCPKIIVACWRSESKSNSAKKPRRPKFKPTMGTPRSSKRRHCAINVPSPPSTTTKSKIVRGGIGRRSASNSSTMRPCGVIIRRTSSMASGTPLRRLSAIRRTSVMCGYPTLRHQTFGQTKERSFKIRLRLLH